MPLFVVETIVTFRHKYVIDCKSADHALDTVAMQEAPEFSQMYLGEQIISSKPLSHSKFKKMVRALKTYGDGTHYQPESGSPWMGKKLIYKVNYDNIPLVGSYYVTKTV